MEILYFYIASNYRHYLENVITLFLKSSNYFFSFSIPGEVRNAVLHKGKRGFGFVLRGAKAASPLMEMIPSQKCPGLQYMDDVDPGGVADMSGIMKGDFLLEVS